MITVLLKLCSLILLIAPNAHDGILVWFSTEKLEEIGPTQTIVEIKYFILPVALSIYQSEEEVT